MSQSTPNPAPEPAAETHDSELRPALIGLVAVFVYGAQSRRAERRHNAANPDDA